ncbi:MAG: SPOR domain-containing protein [Mariprofundus sp.]
MSDDRFSSMDSSESSVGIKSIPDNVPETDDKFSQMQRDFDAMVRESDAALQKKRSHDKPLFIPLHHHNIMPAEPLLPTTEETTPEPRSISFLTALALAVTVIAVIAILTINTTTDKTALPLQSVTASRPIPQDKPMKKVQQVATVAASSVSIESRSSLTTASAPTVNSPVPEKSPQPLLTNKEATKPVRVAAPHVTTPTRQPAPADGAWVINIISSSDRPAMEKRLQQLHLDGIDCDISEVTVSGQQWYRIYVQGFSSIAQAKAALPGLARKYHYKSPWIGKHPVAAIHP